MDAPTQILQAPAEVNVIDLDGFAVGLDINTSSRPFTFYTVDDCGDKTDLNLDTYRLGLQILMNGNMFFESNTDNADMVKSGNQLHLNLTDIELREGIYDYIITFLPNGPRTIKGKLEINE